MIKTALAIAGIAGSLLYGAFYQGSGQATMGGAITAVVVFFVSIGIIFNSNNND